MITARRKKNWSQVGAAEAIGITKSSLGAYEEGRVKTIKYSTQKAIQRAFSIDDWEGFITDPNYFNQQINDEELVKRFNELEPTTKRAVKILLGLSN